MNDQYCDTACPHRELAVGWALHTLEPAEESLVAAHMPECPTCTRTASEAEEVGATLGLSIPEAVPSASLEQRILSVTGATGAASTAPARHITTLLRLRSRELAVAVAALLAAAAVVLGVRVVQLDGELHRAQRQVTDISEAAANPAAVRVPLLAKGGSAVVGMVLASPDRVAVVSTHLPSNRVADQTYVLWGLTSGAPIPLAVFDVVSQAPPLHAAITPTQTGKFTGYAVSLEPGRHAPAAPTDVVASGHVTS